MTNETILERYIAKFPKSKAMFERALQNQPRGVSHDAWFLDPFPVYMHGAEGSRMWDVDGHEYIDYFGGHGALMLGHAHPSLVEAVNAQIKKGTHYGASHDLQVEWAEIIKKLIPSAERVEFTNSGTEANMLAMRLSRAFTGREKIIRFRGHFAGFADHVMVGVYPPWDVPGTRGLLSSDVENTLVIPINDEKALEHGLHNRDIALVMVEAAGAFTGITGIAPDFYQVMRKLTSDFGTLLHFDEVVTGFRYSPGGIQALMGVTPDLTSLGKIITGGMPGAGAIVGRADILDLFSFKDEHWNRYKRVAHSGTFNGNPLCASTGIATLKILADGKPQQHAAEMAQTLRDQMQAAISNRDLSGCVFGDSSVYHIYLGACDIRDQCRRRICLNDAKTISVPVGHLLAMNLMLNGVHGPARGYDGLVSAVHDEKDIQLTVQALEASLDALIKEGMIAQKPD